GKQRRGDADVAEKGAGRLLLDRRLIRLPAEAAEHPLLSAAIPDAVGSARDAVAVGVVGIGARENRRLVDRREQTGPEVERRGTRGDADRRSERAEGEVDERVRRRSQAVRFAVAVRARHLGVLDSGPPLGGNSEDALRVQLVAVCGIAERAAVCGFARHAEAKQQTDEWLTGVDRRPPAANPGMAS